MIEIDFITGFVLGFEYVDLDDYENYFLLELGIVRFTFIWEK